ncbi:hypothetical protein N8I77_003718 [Diaporthe amygdali]|uniref:NAD(P)-binding protein n=1 Tax=Phomopsis amygdali TaxID=1214568 RepID=A0AAD9W662_PHOAM|nr:hypothetical protein N8I77_003718 [Diaporthe amygdali]
MPSYLVTGASHGLGFAFIRKLSSDPSNVVFALVRNKQKAQEAINKEFSGRQNLHVLHGDLGDFESLRLAAKEVARLTGGGLDVLIANASYSIVGFDAISTQATQDQNFDRDMLESFRINVIGNTHLIANFLPLIERGTLKKVVVLSSGMGDVPLVVESEMKWQSPYAISKAALNMAVAKFHAQYAVKGILVMSISPGVVDTDSVREKSAQSTDLAGTATAEMNEGVEELWAAMKRYAPHFSGPITPDQSVAMVLDVVDKATIKDHGGRMISHLGTTRWL